MTSIDFVLVEIEINFKGVSYDQKIRFAKDIQHYLQGWADRTYSSYSLSYDEISKKNCIPTVLIPIEVEMLEDFKNDQIPRLNNIYEITNIKMSEPFQRNRLIL